MVQRYRNTGEQPYLAALYQRYAGQLFGVCVKYLTDSDAAQDACADIYEELVIKLRKYEVDTFSGWLHTLAKNHCLQKLRQSKKTTTYQIQEQFVQSEPAWHLEDVILKETHLTQLQNCLDGLTADQKLAIELFYLQQKSYNEIETQTGIPWNTVRSFIQNGRRNLKNCMEKFGNV